MKPYIGCIIQARLTSSRFPKKILADLYGKPVLEHVVERCYESKLIQKVVIAAPHQLGVCLNEALFIGSENDVLDRYYQCARRYKFDVVVRITSDCPLVPGPEIDRVISRLLERDTHYVTNVGGVGRFGVPDGWDVEAFTFHALKEAWSRKNDDTLKQHVTGWMKINEEFNPIFLEGPKLSIDTKEDFERIKTYSNMANRAMTTTYMETR